MRISYKKGICSKCGKDKLIVVKSKKLCYYCNEKRKSEILKQRLIKKGVYNKHKELDVFYKKVWDGNKEKICYETGVKILKYRKWHIHHVLEKNKYPEHTYNTDVCVLLTLQQHSLWHTLGEEQRKLQMPKTYQKYLDLKNKYGYV